MRADHVGGVTRRLDIGPVLRRELPGNAIVVVFRALREAGAPLYGRALSLDRAGLGTRSLGSYSEHAAGP
jgi:hypothetical protein